jgi:Reverse transcriptase (RNA-dependent DNA polymerase).
VVPSSTSSPVDTPAGTSSSDPASAAASDIVPVPPASQSDTPAPEPVEEPHTVQEQMSIETQEEAPQSPPLTQAIPPSPVPLRRSQRHSRAPQRLDVRHTSEKSYYVPPSHFHDIFSAFNCSYNTQITGPHSMMATSSADWFGAFMARKKADNPDVFTFHQVMQLPDKEEWIKAAQKEISELEEHGVWEEVPLTEVGNHQIVPSTWVFRLKRAPDGTVLKRKARICLRGDLMKGFTDTYSPVVAFSTIRMFLVLSLMLGYKTCSIDFSNAFVQAEMKERVYMKIPKGFKATSGEGKCLKLLRSLYGSLIAPKMWSSLLFSAFEDLGFVQSKLDKCLW